MNSANNSDSDFENYKTQTQKHETLFQPVSSHKSSENLKDENFVDNFAAKLTNRDLCLHGLNITLWGYFIQYNTF